MEKLEGWTSKEGWKGREKREREKREREKREENTETKQDVEGQRTIIENIELGKYILFPYKND